MSRMGRRAAPVILGVLEILGALRTPFATQGRSYRKAVQDSYVRKLVGAGKGRKAAPVTQKSTLSATLTPCCLSSSLLRQL